MGWASGSSLAEEVWEAVRKLIPASRKKMQAARKIIEAFQDCDCDTIQDCERLCDDAGLVYDEEYDEYIYTKLPKAEPVKAKKKPRKRNTAPLRKLIDSIPENVKNQPVRPLLDDRMAALEEWADHCKR